MKLIKKCQSYCNLELEKKQYDEILYRLTKFWSGTSDCSFRCLFEELMGGSEKLEKLLENTLSFKRSSEA